MPCNGYQAFTASPRSQPSPHRFQLQMWVPICLCEKSSGLSKYLRLNTSRTWYSPKQAPYTSFLITIHGNHILLVTLRPMIFEYILTHIFLSDPTATPFGNPIEPAFKTDLKSKHCSPSSPPTSASGLLFKLPNRSPCFFPYPIPTPMVYSQHSSMKNLVKCKSGQYPYWHWDTRVQGKFFNSEATLSSPSPPHLHHSQ